MAKPQPKLPTESDRQMFRRNLSVVLLLAFWFLINVILSWLFDICSPSGPSGLVVYASLGVVVSQVVGMALWLALFPASLLFRIVTVATASVMGGLSLILGAVVFGRWEVSELFKFDALPIVLLGFSLPFFLTRHYFDWRLRFDRMPSLDDSKLSVAGLLLATAIVALSISVLSFGDERLLNTKLIVSMGCTGASFAVFVPMTYLLMTSRWKWTWLVVYTMMPFSIGMANLAFFVNQSGGVSYWRVIGITVSISSLIFWFGIGLVALSRFGCQLTTSKTESV